MAGDVVILPPYLCSSKGLTKPCYYLFPILDSLAVDDGGNSLVLIESADDADSEVSLLFHTAIAFGSGGRSG